MRNFWIVTEADGIKTKHATGPRASGGGFTTDIFVKEGGGSVKKVTIRGLVEGDKLIVEVRVLDPEEIVERVVER